MASSESIAPALPVVRRFGRAHARWLRVGLLATLGWVACRLAMPWPLKGVIEAAFPGDEPTGDVLIRLAPASWDPVLWLCGTYVLLAVGLGIAELFQRSSMTEFTRRTVEDLRSAAVQAVARDGVSNEPGAQGDLIARLVGDAAHLRRDLYGILVHASQNTLLFAAICALLLVLSPEMGLFFLFGGVLATLVGYRAARPTAKHARRQRIQEGTYAATIEVAIEQGNLALLAPDRFDADTDDDEASLGVRADSNLLIHVLLALTVGAALLTGIHQVRAGNLTPGALFLFVAYALTVHRRLVQLGRQLGRIGKVRASVERMASLFGEARVPEASAAPRPLASELRLSQLRLASTRGHGDKPRLGALDLTIPAGSRVAVVGRTGAGKSSLLRSLAGIETDFTGAIYWDGVPLNGGSRPDVDYLPQDPVFAPQKVRHLLGLGDTRELTSEERAVLDRIDAGKVLDRLPRGLEDKVGSLTLSKSEGRTLGLASILLRNASVWVLDAPLDGMARKAAQRRLREILDRAAGRTLVVGLPRFYEGERFDRVLVLKKGKLRFDGTPAEWEAWKAGTDEPEVSACVG